MTAGTSGSGASPGAAAGSDLFLMTGTTTILAPAGQTLAIVGTIADDSAGSLPGGSMSGAATGYTAGTGTGAALQIAATGGGSVVLRGAI